MFMSSAVRETFPQRFALFGRGSVMEQKFRPVFREHLRNADADSFCGAGDQHAFAFEFFHFTNSVSIIR